MTSGDRDLLDARVREIRARLQAATPGPWRDVGENMVGTSMVEGPLVESSERKVIMLTVNGPAPSRPQQAADTTFVAHAPEDIAFLLDQLAASRIQGSVPAQEAPRPDDAEWLQRAVFKVEEPGGGVHWEFTDDARHSGELEERVARLVGAAPRAVEEAAKEIADLQHSHEIVDRENYKLQARIAELEAALEWYATKAGEPEVQERPATEAEIADIQRHGGNATIISMHADRFFFDRGGRARAALSRRKPQPPEPVSEDEIAAWRTLELTRQRDRTGQPTIFLKWHVLPEAERQEWRARFATARALSQGASELGGVRAIDGRPSESPE